MQHRITKPSRLLDKQGRLIQKGYATSPLLKYRRKDVVHKIRLKEWDYYLASNEEYTVALTIANSASIILVSASLIDLVNKKETTKTTIRLLSRKNFSLPESSESGDIAYQDKSLGLSVLNQGGKREILLSMRSPLKKEEFDIYLVLSQEPEDSMVIATPFRENDKMFYYNRKIIGMRAAGYARLGDRTCYFHPEDSYGLLDWGRGVWPYHTTWCWIAAQGMLCGNRFGFNLGYGFGDTTAAMSVLS